MKKTHTSTIAIMAGMLVCLTASARFWGHDHETAIRLIRARYEAVNRSAKRYTKVERDLQGYSVEGGSLTGYFAGPMVRKMVAIHYGETGRAAEEYYFWNGRLFFVLRTDSHYDQPIGSHELN